MKQRPRYTHTGRQSEIAEVPPEECPNGHRFVRGNYTVSWDPAVGRGREYRCRVCNDVIYTGTGRFAGDDTGHCAVGDPARSTPNREPARDGSHAEVFPPKTAPPP